MCCVQSGEVSYASLAHGVKLCSNCYIAHKQLHQQHHAATTKTDDGTMPMVSTSASGFKGLRASSKPHTWLVRLACGAIEGREDASTIMIQ